VRAALVVVIKFLTMHAVDALIDVDLSFRMERLDRALLGATVARRTAFRPAFQPFEHADASGNGECGTERAHIAAVEALNEQAGSQKRQRIDHKWPVTREFEDNRGFERFDLRKD